MIFDLDGTLVDSAQDIAHALNCTLKDLNMPPKSLDEVRDIVGDGVRILLGRATGITDVAYVEKAAKIFQSHYRKHCIDNTVLYPGVRELLGFYSSKKLAVISNKPLEMIHLTLKHCSIEDHFEMVLGPESTSNKKPHPEPILKTLKEFRVSPKMTLMVGDGTTDMEAGKSAGVYTCAVTYGYRRKEELEKYNPDFYIEKFEDLKKIVKE